MRPLQYTASVPGDWAVQPLQRTASLPGPVHGIAGLALPTPRVVKQCIAGVSLSTASRQ